MKRYLWIIILTAFASCKHHLLINRSAVKMIKVVRYRDEHDSITITYTDAPRIRHIVKAINRSEKQPLEFETTCIVHIIFADSVATFHCNGSSMSYKGNTYKMDDSMEEISN